MAHRITLLGLLSTASLLSACGSGAAHDGATDTPSPSAAPPSSMPADGNDPEALGFPTDTCKGFVVDEGEFTVNPGEDLNFCVRIPMPEAWQGPDLALTGWAWSLARTHHFFMEYSPHPFPGPSTDPVPCADYVYDPATDSYAYSPGHPPTGTFSFIGSANNENSKIVFGAGTGNGYVQFDGQHGRYMPASGHFRTSHHLINTGDTPITTHAKFKVCVDETTTIPFLGTSLVCTTTAINVPVGTQGAVTATCTAPFDMDVFLLASHAHAHLTEFTMQFYDGAQTQPDIIYDSKAWDSPEIVNLDTPLHLAKGQGITYTCHYNGPAVFKDTTDDPAAEHCGLFTAYSYPDPRPGQVPPQLTGLETLPDQVTEAFPSLSVSPI